MKFIHFILFLFSLSAYSQSQEELNLEKLKVCLNDFRFQEAFNLCKPENTLFENRTIYNNTENNFPEYVTKISCGSDIRIEQSKIDIEKDAQRIGGMCKQSKIVLVGFEEIDGIFAAAFFDTCNNFIFSFSLDNQNNIIKISRGIVD